MDMEGIRGGEEEEDDEEMLELKLAQIEARLKLKKLQKAREAKAVSSSQENGGSQGASRPSTAMSGRGAEMPRPRSGVEVPMSPVRPRREPEEQRSPARVVLGIDKGLRAQDVSLKRPASAFGRNTNTTTASGYSRVQSARENEAPKVSSFSQRIAESRNKEKEREQKQAKIEKSRSRGFGLKEIESAKDGVPLRPTSFSSGIGGMQNPFSPAKRDSAATGFSQHPPTPRPASNHSSRPGITRAPSSFSTTASFPPPSKPASRYDQVSKLDNSKDAASFESFSSLHLNKRNMDHNKLTRVLDGKTVLTIPQLLKTVKAPDYDPPDMENDYVIFGVICSKSNPLTPKNGRQNQSVGNQDKDANQSGKFMVIKLTDLKWELDLFLFDTGFSQFWKLPLGTLVAVLNPDIMPPRQRDTGKFSLKLTSSDDTVLEVGTARDLDFCHAKRKDGKDCGQWVDGRKTEYCDFHIELQVEKSKRGRMEVNSMTGTGFGRGAGGSKMFGGAGRGAGSKGDDMKREGKFHDKFLHETMYIAPSAGAAARLLDSDENGFERGGSRAERHRKQLAEREKERELAKKLGELGRGAGSDYMRIKGADVKNLPARGDTLTQEERTAKETLDLANDTMGLLSKKADDVSLAPVKRKRTESGPRKPAIHSEPMGWGGANRRGLLLSPEKKSSLSSQDRESSPAKKRARLLLDGKGIREPGRDSLGTSTLDVGLLAAMDDDDDLEII
jgi:minichromosome maintenance protein 10